MYQSRLLGNVSDVAYGFSSVEDGNMSFLWDEEKEVLKNREKFLQKFAIDSKRCAVMSVWDENIIETVTHDTPTGTGKNEKIKADALVTNEKNTALFLLTADCLPVVLYDPVVRAVALIHVGWKSTDTKLVEKVIASMRFEYKSAPRNIIASIGPGIHKESYRFSVSSRAYNDGWRNFLEHLPGGGIAIDLPGYVTRQLLDSGVERERIEVSDSDTAKDSRFFSHFRAGKTKEKEGRFATVVVMK